MQEAKYPNFENIQYSDPPSQSEGLQQQLMDKPNQNIKFVPVLSPSQQNCQESTEYQQYAQYQQNQVIPYAEYFNHNIVPIPAQNSNLLKDQDFQTQKLFLCGVLGVYILWSILFVLLLFPLSMVFFWDTHGGNPIPFICLIIFSFFTIFLGKLGTKKNNRNLSTSIFILLVLLFSYTFFYLSLLGSLGSQSKSQFGWDFVIAIFLIFIVVGNFIFNFIALACLTLSDNKFNTAVPVIVEIFVVVIVAIIYHPIYLICIPFLLPYAICLMNAFKQILNGRFELEKNQVIVGVMASFYCTIVCCTD
ncbi:unnamed protein product (macronuclear) [Paramecium tetraurelia]|uniref:Transmembrane protein n=1 Tax=Paramecium tetraurelia TaxID=5888 RepID=A0C263_PARTE|nr:uncharacterized protein GSPATT00034357001 [Paramecium tetraurelia]CAK64880.1 unnamed protein product [Paramecium tetraurelia]|eukprot:XP_001432277.1 hypothetical protein (macronuclear) [Paramecium tetraurelia strain d4-2]